jgi:hypothetical protein
MSVTASASYGSDTGSKNKYSIEFIQNLSANGFDYELPEKTINLINRIAKQVGAPSYIKTPIFKKREYNAANGTGTGTSNGNTSRYNNHNHKRTSNRTNNSHHGKNRKRTNRHAKNPKPLTDNEWESIRTYETTKLTKNVEGIQKDINKIRVYLNKLTTDTYDLNKEEIMDIMENLVDVADESDMNKLCTCIFDIGSTNGFYSHLYAQLYKELMAKCTVLSKLFQTNYDLFVKSFDTFEYVNPDEDYDRYCELNVQNEKRRSLSKFMANMVNEEIVSVENIMTHMHNLLTKFQVEMSEENKEYVCEEIGEVLHVTLETCIAKIVNHDEFEEMIEEQVDGITDLNKKNYASLTNKSILKMMDIMDVIEEARN